MATLRQIQETFDQTNGAQFLYQPVIDRALFEAKRAFTPLYRILPRRTWNTPIYLFNKRTAFPQAQFTIEDPPSFTGNAGYVTPTASNYLQISFPIKHWQVALDLSKFSIQVARVNGNLVQLELDGASKASIFLRETAYMYGSAAATVNTKRQANDGFDLLIGGANKLAGNAVVNFTMLDAMIDAVKNRLANVIGSQYAFVMTPEMLSALGRQFVQYERWMGKTVVYPRDDRGVMNAPVTDNKTYIDGGLEVMSYRGIPIVESSFLASLGQMGTVTAVDGGGSGSSLVNSQYGYMVEAVTDYGVSLASAEATVTPTAGHNVTVSWSTPTITDIDGNTRPILFYRIHRTVAAGASQSETLYAVSSAFNTSDAAVTSFTDTGLIQNPLATNTLFATTIASSGANAVPDGVTTPRTNPSGHTQQDIWLLPRDPDIAVVPAVNEMHTELLALVNARTQQLALLGDETLALRGSFFAAKVSGAYVS